MSAWSKIPEVKAFLPSSLPKWGAQDWVLPACAEELRIALLLGKRSFFRRQFLLAVLVFWASSLLLGASATAQDTPDYFRQNCISCHTIGGGRLTGPDLKDVTKRQDREWLAKFIMNPKKVIDGGDPYAKKMLDASKSVVMPTPPGITKERAEKLLDLIESESALEESQFKGLQISTTPFTDADRRQGKAIFLGLQSLDAGGAACISCHSTFDLPSLGGGALGPDLTNVYERLGPRLELSSWLNAPGTATMNPIFKNHPITPEEIDALVAYFESTTSERPADTSTSRVAFLLSGLAGAVLGIFVLDSLWKGRFDSVRRSLVEANTSRGQS